MGPTASSVENRVGSTGTTVDRTPKAGEVSRITAQYRCATEGGKYGTLQPHRSVVAHRSRRAANRLGRRYPSHRCRRRCKSKSAVVSIVEGRRVGHAPPGLLVEKEQRREDHRNHRSRSEEHSVHCSSLEHELFSVRHILGVLGLRLLWGDGVDHFAQSIENNTQHPHNI